MIRAIEPKDITELQEIHQKFYKDEFPFPDFCDKFAAAYVVTDDKDESIITMGTLHAGLELVAITNKDKSVRERRRALYEILTTSSYIGSHLGYKQLHAFIQDPSWEKVLLRIGFKPCKGNALFINL